MPQMAAAKREGVRRYGALGSRHADAFSRKWMEAREAGESPLGSPDIGSLADLATGYVGVDRMRVVPFDKEVLIGLVILIAFPLLPLMLTVIPVNEILPRILEIIL